MKDDRSKHIAKSGDGLWSRRDVLSKGALVVSVLALPTFVTRKVQAQTTSFDYYISSTGSDSNQGTLASPWAITSLRDTSPHNASMAGKRVGLVAGSYNVASLTSGSTPSDYQHPVFHIPAGSSSAPTYVASCDSNGNYSRGAAVITYGSGAGVNAVFGQNPNSGGYWELDGVAINGGGYDGCLVYASYPTTGSIYTGSGTAQGITIQNCEIYGITASIVGHNEACIFLQGALNAVVRNNYLHDVQKPSQPDHAHAYEEYGCTGTQFIYNTVSNCCSGIDAKAGDSGTVVAYNYFYNSGHQVAGANCGVLCGFDGAEGNPNPPNTPYVVHHNVFDSCGMLHACDVNDTTSQAIYWYNNTSYGPGNSSVATLDLRSSASGLIQCYNNILVVTGSAAGAYMGAIAFSSGGFTILDYNDYYFGSYSAAWGLGGNTEATLAAWQSASSADLHSLAVNPQFASAIVPGAGAAQFQLASNSPCKGVGRSNGTSSGAACDMGAWGNGATAIGCNFLASVVPNPPTLSIS